MEPVLAINAAAKFTEFKYVVIEVPRLCDHQYDDRYGVQYGDQQLDHYGNQYGTQLIPDQCDDRYGVQHGDQYDDQYGNQYGDHQLDHDGNQYGNQTIPDQCYDRYGVHYGNQYGDQQLDQDEVDDTLVVHFVFIAVSEVTDSKASEGQLRLDVKAAMMTTTAFQTSHTRLKARAPRRLAGSSVGLGRSVASCDRSSTPYQMR